MCAYDGLYPYTDTGSIYLLDHKTLKRSRTSSAGQCECVAASLPCVLKCVWGVCVDVGVLKQAARRCAAQPHGSRASCAAQRSACVCVRGECACVLKCPWGPPRSHLHFIASRNNHTHARTPRSNNNQRAADKHRRGEDVCHRLIFCRSVSCELPCLITAALPDSRCPVRRRCRHGRRSDQCLMSCSAKCAKQKVQVTPFKWFFGSVCKPRPHGWGLLLCR